MKYSLLVKSALGRSASSLAFYLGAGWVVGSASFAKRR